MNTYELTLILKPELSEKESSVVIEKIEKLVLSSKGKIEKIEKIGKKSLSYQIKKYSEGIYVFMILNLMPKEVLQIDRKIKLDENVIRYLLIISDITQKTKKLEK